MVVLVVVVGLFGCFDGGVVNILGARIISEGPRESFFPKKSTGGNSIKAGEANRSQFHIIWSCVLTSASVLPEEADIGKHLAEK